MLRIVVGVLGLAFVIAPVAVAQQGIDTVRFEQGQQLYQDNCALYHKVLHWPRYAGASRLERET